MQNESLCFNTDWILPTEIDLQLALTHLSLRWTSWCQKQPQQVMLKAHGWWQHVPDVQSKQIWPKETGKKPTKTKLRKHSGNWGNTGKTLLAWLKEIESPSYSMAKRMSRGIILNRFWTWQWSPDRCLGCFSCWWKVFQNSTWLVPPWSTKGRQ